MQRDLQMKDWIQVPKHFCDLYNGSIFSGKQVLKPQDVRQLPTESITILTTDEEKLEAVGRYHDVVYESKLGNRYVILPVENQEEIHLAMPIRNMLYDAMLYTKQVESLRLGNKENKSLHGSKEFLSGLQEGEKVKAILPLVFYYGEEPWDHPLELHDLLEFPEELKQYKDYFPNYKLNVIQVGNAKPEQFQTGLREVFELLHYKRDKQGMKQYLKEHKERYEHISEDTGTLIGIVMGVKTLMGEKKEKYQNEEGEVNMCTAIQEMLQDEWKEGQSVGVEQGLLCGEEKLSKLCQLLLEEGKSEEMIQAITDKEYRKCCYESYQM